MKVAHFNTYLTGGAATAARRLHDTLVAEGVESVFCYATGAAPSRHYRPYFEGAMASARQLWGYARRARVAPFLVGRERYFEYTDNGWLLPVFPRARGLDPDIVHLHWIADFIDYEAFFRAAAGTPVVWTLHDMHPFTGGCHYSYDCERFAAPAGCGPCPQLNGLRSPRDLSHDNFERKRRAIEGAEVHVVADSRWLEAEARRSAILAGARSFRTIHYGLDTDAFAPQDKILCRRALGIADDAFVVCFGAESLDHPRKGLHELLRSLRAAKEVAHLTGLMFGAGAIARDDALPPLVSTGYLSTPQAQATAYSAADVFVIPSLAEAFGQTALEAMACGTPVIGFETGGIPDMVRPGDTGLLVPVGDVGALASAIRWAAAHRAELAGMGRNARALVLGHFTLRHQSSEYRALYEALARPRQAAAAASARNRSLEASSSS